MTENITVNTQSSIRIAADDIVYFDPFEIGDALHDADVIFLTHDHYDHFSPEDIGKVAKPGTKFVVPAGMAAAAAKKGKIAAADIISVRPGERGEVLGYSFETVPSYNKLKPFHPKRNGWCGYVVGIGGKRYYVAGDTDNTEEAGNVTCDVALVPIGGTYTMNVREAAALVNKIRPEAVIPTHYGSIVGKREDGARFQELVEKDIHVVCKL